MPYATIWTIMIATAPVWAQADLESAAPRPSVSAAFAYLERSDAQLRRIALAERGTSVRTADEYAKEISRFHVELGRLPVDKDTRKFIADSLARLQLQELEVEQLAEKAQSDEQAALNKPLSHIRIAIGLSEMKLNRSRDRRWLKFRFGEPAPDIYQFAPWAGYAGWRPN